MPKRESPSTSNVPRETNSSDRLTLSEVAAECDVALATTHGWLKEGLISERKGKERLIWRKDVLKFLAHRQPFAPGSQRERLARAQGEKVELENARRRGELILVSAAMELMSGLSADLCARLEGLPGRMANELAGISDASTIRTRLLEEVRAIRDGIADYLGKLVGYRGAPADAGADVAPATPPKPQRVGRRKARAPGRQRRARAVEK
jgi:hypothetical protein